jgi:hypothetical protein
MTGYRVTLSIDVDADTPEQAAEAAHEVLIASPSFPDRIFRVRADDDDPGLLVKVDVATGKAVR